MISEITLWAVALFISVPLWVIGTECIVGLFSSLNVRSNTDLPDDTALTYKILIPAHNEVGIINKTLTQLIAQLPDSAPENIIVVADNCTDDTAHNARTLNVTVLERHDTVNRGKGFALDFGIQYLLKSSAKPSVLIVMDADCETDRQSLIHLIKQVNHTALPAQMINIMRVVNQAGLKQKVAGFAWLVKNKIRPLALSRLNLPVLLTGTGMAFPGNMLPHIHLGSANIVEDTQLGIDCAINGFPPRLCENATVFSDFPTQASAELTQRTRWEHGHLQTIIHQVPRLLREFLMQKNPALLALALDVGVPPLSLLVMLASVSLLGVAVLSWLIGHSFAAKVLCLSFSYFAIALIAVWWKFGRRYLSAKELLAIPYYVLAKLSIYTGFLGKRQKDWVRTERDSQP